MRYIIFIFTLLSILIAFFFSQNTKLTIPETPNQTYSIPFKVPVIYDTSGIFVEDSGYTELTYSSVFTHGLFPFSDTVEFSDAALDYLYENMITDDSRHFWDYDDRYGSGLKVIVDPKAWIPYPKRDYGLSQPVYIVNETSKPIILDAYFESHMLTEAKDENGYWFPIEINGVIGCGNGRYPTKICPQEVLVVGMKKHSGSFKTELRIRLKSGAQMIVSDPFPGGIDPNQFNISKEMKDRFGLGNEIQITDYGFIQNFFLGAIPKQAYELLN